MQCKFSTNELVFETDFYYTHMNIINKGIGHDKGEPLLRCYVAILVNVKRTQQIIHLNANYYWDGTKIKTSPIFTGGSLKEFIHEQNEDYEQFQLYWQQIKRLMTNVFSDQDIKELQQAR